jgi:hypothetical protein
MRKGRRRGPSPEGDGGVFEDRKEDSCGTPRLQSFRKPGLGAIGFKKPVTGHQPVGIRFAAVFLTLCLHPPVPPRPKFANDQIPAGVYRHTGKSVCYRPEAGSTAIGFRIWKSIAKRVENAANGIDFAVNAKIAKR